MYSGEESSGDALNSAGQFGNWPISSTTCNNMSQEQVDWAALAQQWIQMKESTSFVPMAPPPPAGMPSINYEEKGEEDMEVVKEDDGGFGGNSAPEIHNNSNSIYRNPPEWQQPSWYSDQSQWRPGWNNWPNGSSHSINVSEINAPPAPSMTILKGTAAVLNHKTSVTEAPVDSIPTMDAAKRKTLPAWIREGLEKMEKEKLKQLEKQKETQPKSSELLSTELNVSPERLTNEIIKIKTDKSFQASDQSNDDDEEDNDGNDTIKLQPTVEASSNNKPVVAKSREEWLEEWMLIVRRSLTELLLEVTNEEILNVAQETLKKNKIKASSAQVLRKSAISSITGKLGLGAYADSASENSESEEDYDEENYEHDSEEEIKESIRNRQNTFKAVAQEIELNAKEAELREQRRNAEHAAQVLETKATKKGYDKDSGETQPDKKNQSNGKRSRERTSRFSDAKDLKHRNSTYSIIHTAALPSSSSEFDKRKTSNVPTTVASSSSKTKRYSNSSDSSSSSSESYRRRKHRRTRDRKHKSSSSRRETSRASSDSDDYSRRSKKYRSSYSRDRSRSRSRSRSYTGKSRY